MTDPVNPIAPALVERLRAWADAGDMGGASDPSDMRREAADLITELLAALEGARGHIATLQNRYSAQHRASPGHYSNARNVEESSEQTAERLASIDAAIARARQ